MIGDKHQTMDKILRKCLVAALSMAALLPAAAKDKDNSIGVMSFNIRTSEAKDGTNSWDFRAPAVLEMIKDQAPDILGLQEATEMQVKMLDYFLDDYKSVGVGREDGKKDGEHMSIYYNKGVVSLSKWGTIWLSETPDKPSKGWDAAYKRTATWALFKDKDTGSRFYCVNTHLDNEGSQAREEGLKLILSEVAGMNAENLPVILMGDFNMTPENPALDVLKGKMFNARYTAVKTDDLDSANTWGKSFSKIDYIWYKNFSSCVEYETLTKSYENRTYISDHFPIKAKLIF